MNYIGGVSEFNYSPIQDFNNALKNDRAFNVPDDAEKSFDSILESKRKPEKTDMDRFMDKVGTAFSDGLNSVNNDALEAERAEEILATGGDISAHEVMIAAEKSNLSLQMAVQIRNRLINAYTEINGMQI